MAERKRTRTARERDRDRLAAERRESALSSLGSAVASYSAALDIVSSATKALVRGARALDVSCAAAASPDLVQYGVVGRLRPAALHRAVSSISRDLLSKAAAVRSSGLSVPDGTEAAYSQLVLRLSSAADSVADAIDEFGRSLPPGSSRPHPAVRDLIMSASRAAVFLNRLVGRGRTSASVHSAAVQAEIVSGDVSFY